MSYSTKVIFFFYSGFQDTILIVKTGFIYKKYLANEQIISYKT